MAMTRVNPALETESDPTIRTLKNGVTIEDLPNYSKRVTIPTSMMQGGFVAVFADPTAEDFEQFELWVKDCQTNLEAVRRLGARLCTKWGDKDGCTPDQWLKLRAVVMAVFAQVVNDFFPESENL